MADFVQSNVTKSAVRELADPIADVATERDKSGAGTGGAGEGVWSVGVECQYFCLKIVT